MDGLVGTGDLVFVKVNAALGYESDTTLGIARLILRKEFKLVIFQLKVPDVAVAGDR